MIESESGRDTSKQVPKANGGKGLGLFQVLLTLHYITFRITDTEMRLYLP